MILSEENIGVVRDLIRFALSSEGSRKPIKREDIRELVLKKSNKLEFKKIFSAAQSKLKSDFGCELVELPAKKKLVVKNKTSKKSQPGTGRYILRSIIDPELRRQFPIVFDTQEEKFNGVIAVVLSLVFLNYGTITLDSLLNRIEQLGLPNLPFFPDNPLEDIRNKGIELISALLKLEYLAKVDTFSKTSTNSRAGATNSATSQAPNSALSVSNAFNSDVILDGNSEYSWGPRAVVEYSYPDITKFISELTDSIFDQEFLEKVSKSSGVPMSDLQDSTQDTNTPPGSNLTNSTLNETENTVSLSP
ncbi:hypothetical protein BB560_003171 [Smittium megazygosporum]|uniref:MAGE domain-containing protein n=1 Tax=Smittium megazygosporum TaxID=133381 RepID=A0A2T9ZCQ8_9FUNG|nr:hypothetical protein BB560_003171 [Smittium megazygosporum]